MKTNKIIILITIFTLLIVGYIIFKNTDNAGPSKLDGFAQCLTEKNAKFYGAFWCSHCQSQKKLFGSSVKYVNYIECSTPDGQGVLPICKENGIVGYPTWTFNDESRLSGEISLEELSSKTQCPLPQ